MAIPAEIAGGLQTVGWDDESDDADDTNETDE